MNKEKKNSNQEAFNQYLESGIDFSNTEQLVNDLWLFLTDKPLYDSATIKKEAFTHEVTAMINTIREYERDTTLKGLSVMSPEQFQQFLELRGLKK